MNRPAAVERRIVSVLFADLVGFTPLSERFDAEDVAAVQDAYFAAVRETVARHGGALEKFMGDAAMAVFGLDRARDDDAVRAVRTGLALAGAVERLGGQLGLDPGELQLRVGIESGEIVSAEAGPDQGRVTGDVVNTAARLQSAAPAGGVLLGAGASLAVAAAVELGDPVPIELKGKAGPVRASLALGLRPEPTREAAMGVMRAAMIGREVELQRLRRALAGAADGGSTAIVIVAPPGTGKSRLLAEFVAGTSTPAWRSRARADAMASLEPLVGLARAAIGAQSTTAIFDRLAHDVSATRARVLGDAIGALVGTAEGATDPLDRDSRFAAWTEALDGLAAPGPVIWAVEDVHWASGDVLAFLAFAARAAARHGRLIVATARPSVIERLDPAIERLELSPLPPADAGRLLVALVGDALPPELVAAIEDRSDGNPLFIEELLRSWVAVGTLVVDDGAWRLTRSPGVVGLPATVQGIYAGQLDDLPPPVRDVARRASVAGRRFPSDALAALGVVAPAPGIEGLLSRALVSGPVADPVTGPGYAYRHALLRDAGYGSLGRADRARLHVRLAGWLEGVAGDRTDAVADMIGTHYEAALAAAPALAHEVDEGKERPAVARLAADWLERAAEAATRLSASDATMDLLRRALVLTDPPDGLDAARRELLLGETIATSGDMDDGAHHVALARDRYRARLMAAASSSEEWTAARDGYARAAVAVSRLVREQLRFDEARELADAALADVGRRDDLAGVRLELAAATAHYFVTDQAADVLPAAGRALAVARRDGDATLELQAMEMLTVDDDAPPEVFMAAWRDLGLLARSQGRWELACRALRMQAMASLDLSADPQPLLDEAAELAVARGLTEALAWTEYARAETGYALGEWDVAWAAGLRALELAERGAYHRVAVRTWHALVPMAAARGRRDVLERAARWYADHDAIFPDSAYGRLMRRFVSLHFAAAGLTPPIAHDIEPLLASFEGELSGGTTLEAADALISGWLRDGHVEAAGQALGRMEPGTRESVFPDVPPAWQLLTARLRLAGGDAPAAIALARTALPLFRALPRPPWTAKAIRLLEAAGAAGAEEVAEARAIEARLGVV